MDLMLGTCCIENSIHPMLIHDLYELLQYSSWWSESPQYLYTFLFHHDSSIKIYDTFLSFFPSFSYSSFFKNGAADKLIHQICPLPLLSCSFVQYLLVFLVISNSKYFITDWCPKIKHGFCSISFKFFSSLPLQFHLVVVHMAMTLWILVASPARLWDDIIQACFGTYSNLECLINGAQLVENILNMKSLIAQNLFLDEIWYNRMSLDESGWEWMKTSFCQPCTTFFYDVFNAQLGQSCLQSSCLGTTA